jgi:hypothetical protein
MSERRQGNEIFRDGETTDFTDTTDQTSKEIPFFAVLVSEISEISGSAGGKIRFPPRLLEPKQRRGEGWASMSVSSSSASGTISSVIRPVSARLSPAASTRCETPVLKTALTRPRQGRRDIHAFVCAVATLKSSISR